MTDFHVTDFHDIPPRLKSDGTPCCTFFDSAGPRLLQACEPCQQYYLHELERRRDAAPPDPYKVGLAVLRAANSIPEPRQVVDEITSNVESCGWTVVSTRYELVAPDNSAKRGDDEHVRARSARPAGRGTPGSVPGPGPASETRSPCIPPTVIGTTGRALVRALKNFFWNGRVSLLRLSRRGTCLGSP